MEGKEFELVLDSDETIIETFKPNKTRFLVINSITSSIFILIFGFIFIAVGLGAHLSTEGGDFISLGIFGGIGLLAVLLMILSIVANIVTFKKTIYAITNKRLLIKSGFIGADFKSLDLITIGAMSVRVDFLDKLIKSKNTGTIDFGSMSMPMNNNPSGQASNPSFSFKHIDNPYDIYKEIKEYINKAKNNK